MKSMLRLLVALLLVGGWSLAALALHVIIAPRAGAGDTLPVRIIVLPKEHLGITETYVDTRQWSIDDVSNHPVIAKRMLDAGKADALQHVLKSDTAGADVQTAIADAIARGPQPPPTSAPAVGDTRDATQAGAHATTTISTKHTKRGSR